MPGCPLTGRSLPAKSPSSRPPGAPRFSEIKASGTKTDRPELVKLLHELEPGDVLVVSCLDRLARSTRDLLNILDNVSKKGAKFRSLRDHWADTTTPQGELMITVLGGLATFERHLIRIRTGEG